MHRSMHHAPINLQSSGMMPSRLAPDESKNETSPSENNFGSVSVASGMLDMKKPPSVLPRRTDSSRDPFRCRMAASPYGNHLARERQVGEGVSPALDARRLCTR